MEKAKECKVVQNIDFSPKFMAYVDIKFKKNQKWNVVEDTQESITITRDCVKLTIDRRDFQEVFKYVF